MNLIRWLTTALCMLGAASPLCAGSQPQGPEARESAVCAEPAARTELRVVYSEDGLEFIGLGERFVVHAAAPDLIRLPGGELLALFDCAVRPDKENETVLAVSRSEDDGESWSAVKPIVLSGSDSRTTTAMRAVHGDLLRTRGRYLRLFFSAATRSEPGRPGGGPRGRTVIRSAVTRDGLHYRLDPAVRIRAVDRSGAADPHPTAVRVGGQIHLYLATLARPENDAAARAATAEHVISRDGRRFARIAPAQTPDANFVGSVVSFAGGLRAYVSSRAGIRSATSRDGRIWRVEPGVRVTDGWDPAVVRLEDGSFMMVYCAALEDGTTAPSVRTQGSPGQQRAARAGGAAGDERYARRRRDAVGDDVLAVGESEYDTWYREMSEYSLVPLADEEELTLVAGGSPGDPIVQGIPLEGFDMDASGEAWGMTEFDDGFPARPDFNTPVDYVQWYEDLAAGEAKPGENAFDVYEAFIPGVGPDPAGAVEWPELKNMFSDENYDGPPGPWHPATRPEWEASNQAVQTLLAGFRDASLRERYVQLPIFPEEGPHGTPAYKPLLIEMMLPGLSPHRHLAKATLADTWRLEGGKVSPERMVDAWETVLRNADHLSQGATLIEQLVATAERGLVQRNARWALQHKVFSPEGLETAMDVLMECDRDTTDPALGPRGEYACSMEFTQFLFSPAGSAGEPRFNLERAEYVTEHVFDWTDAPDVVDTLSGMGADDVRATVDALDAYYRDVAEQLRIGYPDVRAADVEETSMRYVHTSAMTKLLLPSLSRVHQLRARDEASRRATQLCYATHLFKVRHGYWPESLDELPAGDEARMRSDPFTGHDFGYRLTDDGPVIYSLSENGLDDGGVHSPRWNDQVTNNAGSDDYVFWPPQDGE